MGFSQGCPGDGEKRVGEPARGDVPEGGDPLSDLVLVQTEQVLAVLVVFLSHPSVMHLNLAMRSLLRR